MSDYSKVPPPYSQDILAPPVWNGPPGQLLNYPTSGFLATDKYTIYGTDSQIVQVTLYPGEFIFSEPGAMVYRGKEVKILTEVGGCCNGCGRCLGGESFFRNKYTNQGPTPEGISLSPKFPAKIIPIDLSRSGPVNVTPGSYIGHIGDIKVTFKFIRNVLAGCFGGSGFLMTHLVGNGVVFVAGGGTIMEKVLAPGESVLVDTSSVVGFSESITYEVRVTGGCLTCCCGGEGLFNDILVGPGLVVTQSMSLKRLQAAVARAPPSSNNSSSQPPAS